MIRYLLIGDLKNGIGKRIGYLIPAVFFGFYGAMILVLQGAGSETVTFPAAIFECFQGMHILNTIEEVYSAPPFFILLHTWLAFAVSAYIYRDLKERGKVVFIRCRSRISWWVSKSVWIVGFVFAYYLTIWISAFITVSVTGEGSFSLSEAWWNGYCMAEGNLPGQMEIVLYFLIVPFVTSTALAMMQMFLSVWLSPIAGIVGQVFILLLSLCYCTVWLPGNYLMLRRSDIYTAQGIPPLPALLIDLGIFLAGLIGGMAVLRRKDIL